MRTPAGIMILMTFCCVFASAAEEIVVTPSRYDRALRNPLKGFTSGSEWETLRHTYIRWNEIEDRQTDGIGKINAYCDEKWRGFAENNIKAIPRVYLHWEGNDKKFWPSDMSPDDYSSPQFTKRALRLIDRLGQCWDNDPRVAFVELGIFGKWGEHHSPPPTPEMQRLIGDAFVKAFPNKCVLVRHPWLEFEAQPFGVYWDSWAHHQQLRSHGQRIADHFRDGLWKRAYIGGEVAYNWGDWRIQPGKTPTDSVSKAEHRDHLINAIRWLHCTQLRWISRYDSRNADAVKGAEQMQKAFGYRFVLDEVRFSMDQSLKVTLVVTNHGSAPLYYNWPVEISLLDPATRKVVWRSIFKDLDIRHWLPGDHWTEPTWISAKGTKVFGRWTGNSGWRTPPPTNRVSEQFDVAVPAGTYTLALAVLDPGGDSPSLRFATRNYINGGRHPIGIVAIGRGHSGPLPKDFKFDDPHNDRTLHYAEDPRPAKR